MSYSPPTGGSSGSSQKPLEFVLAAQGNVTALRTWLRAHPERVNIPNPILNVTLLHSAVSGCKRADLDSSLAASGQRQHSPPSHYGSSNSTTSNYATHATEGYYHLDTVRMLCGEFSADPFAPSGGTQDTAFHTAAKIGGSDVLRFLMLERDPASAGRAANARNLFGDRPIDFAQRCSLPGARECVQICQEAERLHEELQRTGWKGTPTLANTLSTMPPASFSSSSPLPPPPPALPTPQSQQSQQQPLHSSGSGVTSTATSGAHGMATTRPIQPAFQHLLIHDSGSDNDTEERRREEGHSGSGAAATANIAGYNGDDQRCHNNLFASPAISPPPPQQQQQQQHATSYTTRTCNAHADGEAESAAAMTTSAAQGAAATGLEFPATRVAARRPGTAPAGSHDHHQRQLPQQSIAVSTSPLVSSAPGLPLGGGAASLQTLSSSASWFASTPGSPHNKVVSPSSPPSYMRDAAAPHHGAPFKPQQENQLLSADLAYRRKQVDISSCTHFKNEDLRQFRTEFGDGFTYVECSDHYEITGLLPYAFREVMYYTPVIIMIYGPTRMQKRFHGDAAAAFAAKQRQGGTSYSRYRVQLDRARMNEFTVSRRACYIDPVSNAFIVSAADGVYRSLVSFIQRTVVAAFETTAPITVINSPYAFPRAASISCIGTNKDIFLHHRSRNTPLFMKTVLNARSPARLLYFRILQDLSAFGDGLMRYRPAQHMVVGYIPVMQETHTEVLAISIPSLNTYFCGGGGAGGDVAGSAAIATTTSSQDALKCSAIEVETVMNVRVRIQFTPTITQLSSSTRGGSGGGGTSATTVSYDRPPTIFLVDAVDDGGSGSAAGGDMRALTYKVFQHLLRPGSGMPPNGAEVAPSVLEPVLSEWAEKGSLLDLLVHLKKLLKACVSHAAEAMRARGGVEAAAAQTAFPSSVSAASSPPSLSPADSPSSGGGAHLLDAYFSPVLTTVPTSSGGGGGGGGDAAAVAGGAQVGLATSGSRCLLCFCAARELVLEPCKHLAMCKSCAGRLANHYRDALFPCPVCKRTVNGAAEVYL